MIAFAAVPLGCSAYDDLPEVTKVVQQIEGRHNAIQAVTYKVDWLDPTVVSVQLVDESTDRAARGVWCNVIVAQGLDERVRTRVLGNRDGKRISWPQPKDCADASDVPRGRR